MSGQRVEVRVLGEWVPATVEGTSSTGATLVRLDEPIVDPQYPVAIGRVHRGAGDIRPLPAVGAVTDGGPLDDEIGLPTYPTKVTWWEEHPGTLILLLLLIPTLACLVWPR